jgi:hypothetical protein
MTTIFLQFLLAHFLGDFVLQTTKWVKDKEEKGLKSIYLWVHIGIHFLLMFVLTSFKVKLIPVIVAIGLSHLIIDVIKIKLKDRLLASSLFFGDQLLHLLSLVGTLGFYFDINWIGFLDPSERWIIWILAFIMLTSVSAVVLKVVLSKWDLKTFEDEALEKAGLYIGILERLFIFGFVVMEYWAGIGFLIAAKSIFRFSDLSRSKDRKLTEYVLIGTLLSYGLAIVIALGALWALRQ